VEEEIVSRWEEGRWRVEVCPEGPKGLDGSKSGDLLDALFVVGDLIARRALLAEPENPSVREEKGWSDARVGRWMAEGRTYVLRRGCIDAAGRPADVIVGLFSSKDALERVVEKCFEGTREGGGEPVERDEESLSLLERNLDWVDVDERFEK
jgi:hypothetical protein